VLTSSHTEPTAWQIGDGGSSWEFYLLGGIASADPE
jgi:hypothetical protein